MDTAADPACGALVLVLYMACANMKS